jgi:hypothetical protein
MANYSPQPAVTIRNVEELRQWIEDELGSLAQAFNELSRVIELTPVHKAPDLIRDGMIIFADGTNFNPGAGRGTYERKAGAWVKL